MIKKILMCAILIFIFSACSIESDPLAKCFKVQKKHSYYAKENNSRKFMALSIVPNIEENECENLAITTENIRDLELLMNSEDPLIVINVAQNDSVTSEILG